MSKRGGIFGLFKKDEPEFSEEEKAQRDYALQKEKEDGYTDSSESEEEPGQPVSEEIVEFCQSKLDELLNQSKLFGQAEVIRAENETISLDIINPEDPGRVIGKDGSTLNAFQTLLRAFVYNKFNTPLRIFVDSGEYKKKKIGSLQEKAKRIAKKVKQTGKAYDLEPMNAQERRSIHILFENDTTISTFSAGEGRERHVIISKK